MSIWRKLLITGLVAFVTSFVFGYVTGRHINPDSPVLREIPLVGGPKPIEKPKYGRVIQDGQVCELIDRHGYKKGDDGCPVAIGKEFTVGFHTVREGWTVTVKDGMQVFTAVITNNNPGPISSFDSSIYLKQYDGALVELISCESPPFDTGQSRAVSCKPSFAEPLEPFYEVAVNL